MRALTFPIMRSAMVAMAVLVGLHAVPGFLVLHAQEKSLRATVGNAPPPASATVGGDCPPLTQIGKDMTLDELMRRCPGGPDPDGDAESVWLAVQATESPAVLRQFIQQFPDSIYATFAKARLEELEGSQVVRPVDPPPPPPPPPQVQVSTCYVDDVRPPDAWLALRTEPTSRSGQRLAKLPSGTALQMLGPQSSDWHLVRTDNGMEGWVSWATRRWISC